MGDFDSTAYFRFSNDAYPGNTLSSGQQRNSNGEINMTVAEVFSSSENWQIYYQNGRYFIRNYDYGGDWQLGLDDNAKSIPRMLRRSGALGQQWTLTGDGDGKYTFTNGMLGNGSWLALVGKNTIPGMQPSTQGNKWDITINPSAGSPPEGSMMKDVANFEEPPASTTSQSSSSPTAAPTTSVIGSSTTLISSSTGISRPTANSSSGSTLSTGAIVGIAIGSVALIAAIGFFAFFFWRRSRRSNPYVDKPAQELATTENPVELNSPTQETHLETYKQQQHLMRPVEIG